MHGQESKEKGGVSGGARLLFMAPFSISCSVWGLRLMIRANFSSFLQKEEEERKKSRITSSS